MKDYRERERKTVREKDIFIPPKDISAHKISYNFLQHIFYSTQRAFIGFISSNVAPLL
jgi:hypothetical protein